MATLDYVLVFPGQGVSTVHNPGTLPTYWSALGVLPEVDSATRRLLGLRVTPNCGDQSVVFPLLLYAAAVGHYLQVVKQGDRPSVVMGHSFGEIAALVCAGGFSVQTGAEIICHRTLAMEALSPRGAMVALHANRPFAEQILRLIGGDVAVAAENSARQTVLSGSETAVGAVIAVAAASRVRAKRLRAKYPYHCRSLMEAAASDFLRRIEGLPSTRLRTPVYSPIFQRFYNQNDHLLRCLADHLLQPVMLKTAISDLCSRGFCSFVEAGLLRGLLGSEGEQAGAAHAANLLPGSNLLALAAVTKVCQ
jgi:acyl transferase domain-containing protein